jgi:hypothetical protein
MYDTAPLLREVGKDFNCRYEEGLVYLFTFFSARYKLFAAKFTVMFNISQVLFPFLKLEILEPAQSSPPQENNRRRWVLRKTQRMPLNPSAVLF